MSVPVIRLFRLVSIAAMILSLFAGVSMVINMTVPVWQDWQRGNDQINWLQFVVVNVHSAGLPALTSFLVACVLFVGCEIALHLRKVHQPGPDG